MSSESIETRTTQKAKLEAALKAKIDKLKEAGVSDKDQAKDPALRAAKAKLRKANKRLEAIEAKKAHVEKTKEDKAKAKAAPKQNKGDKAKKAAGKEKPKAKKPKKAAK